MCNVCVYIYNTIFRKPLKRGRYRVSYSRREPATQIGPIFLFIICTRINGLWRITIDRRVRPSYSYSVFVYIHIYIHIYHIFCARALSLTLHSLNIYNNFDRPRTPTIRLRTVCTTTFCSRGGKHNFQNGNIIYSLRRRGTNRIYAPNCILR